MSIVDRVRNILLTPKTEWPVIAAEPATVGGLFKGYAAIVALLPPIGALIGALLFGRGFGLGFVLVQSLLAYAIGLALLYVMAIIADALAPGFNGVKSQVQATKLVVYSASAQWVAGFFAFIPGINIILSLAGFAYGAYLLYLGCMATLSVPEAKAPAYTAVLIVIWIILAMVVAGAIVSAVVFGLLGGMMLGSPYAA